MVAAAVSACACLAWAAKDPVLMRVGNLEVPVSEFEYLYHKNTQQQLEAQPMDEYVDLFTIYKLKVADALAAGKDTTQSMRRDMAKYRRELAAPFLADSAFLNNLVQEAYERSRTELELAHIMIMKGQTPAEQRANRLKLDSIRSIIINEGRDFAEMARAFSQDRTSAQNGGTMGYITSGRLPYRFETVAYATPDGGISEVVESPMAYHIIKRLGSRPARGTVLAGHIMKMIAPGASAEEEAAAKAWADSIYTLVSANPAIFEQVAMNSSDDKGSARQGGMLPWFGAGMMVAPFDSAAFALQKGEISKPVRSQYGWHVIRKVDAKAPESLEEMKPEVLARVMNPQDERSKLVRENNDRRLARKHKGQLLKPGIERLHSFVSRNGLDSTFYDACRNGELSQVAVAKIGKKTYTASDMMDRLRVMQQPDVEAAVELVDNFADGFLSNRLMDTEYEWLEANEPEYGNLIREYHDGSLLYEISVEKVWDKASKDTEGLARYFEAHKGDYTWQKPHVKGLLVQATNEEVAQRARQRLATMAGDTVVPAMRKEFGKDIVIERVLVEQGANPMVDNIVFGTDAVRPSAATMTTYFLYEPKVLMAPEEVSDVRGLVTSDYQTELESLWVEELKAKYPVSIDRKVLKKVK